MKTLKDKFLTLIDTTASQACGILDGFNTMVNEIDWDSHFDMANEFIREQKEKLTIKANELMNDFSELVKQVKNNLIDFSVTVAYDESIGEKLEYEVKKDENGIASLAIEVSFNDENTTRSNKTVVKIPNNCDLEKVSKVINKSAKTATIIIPKIIKEQPSEQKPTNTVAHKTRKTVHKKVADRSKENSEERNHISSKLAERLKQNVEKAKLRRDASGRFVRREVTEA